MLDTEDTKISNTEYYPQKLVYQGNKLHCMITNQNLNKNMEKVV